MARLNLNLSIPGDRKTIRKKTYNLDQTIKIITEQHLPPDVEKAMIEKIKTYPASAYKAFLNKMTYHINEIQKKMNYIKEENGK